MKNANSSIAKPVTLTPNQLKIYKDIISLVESRVTSMLKCNSIEDYMLSLKGPAGAGKTYITIQLAKHFLSKNSSDFDFVITSPTHKAAGVITTMLNKYNINATCKTIHSFIPI